MSKIIIEFTTHQRKLHEDLLKMCLNETYRPNKVRIGKYLSGEDGCLLGCCDV
jgi:hypothetical protein